MDYLEKAHQKALEISPAEIVDGVIMENKEKIVQKVREQWKEGVRPDGTIIGVYKGLYYARKKRAMNPAAGGNVDLILSGSLNENLTVNPLKTNIFSIYSTDKTAEYMEDRYGLDVFGMNIEEKELFIQEAIQQALDIMVGKMYA